MSLLKLARIYYPVYTLGFGKRVGLWVAGCQRRCEGCLSPQMQHADHYDAVEVQRILQIIHAIEGDIDGFSISGGEPFDQAEALGELVEGIRETHDDILIFTGYTLHELQNRRDPNVDAILSAIAVLIDGEYVRELDDGRGLRGSSNQRIHIFMNEERHAGLACAARRVQQVHNHNEGKLIFIGIP